MENRSNHLYLSMLSLQTHHLYSTLKIMWKFSFPRRFKVEYMWRIFDLVRRQLNPAPVNID